MGKISLPGFPSRGFVKVGLELLSVKSRSHLSLYGLESRDSDPDLGLDDKIRSRAWEVQMKKVQTFCKL